jgi:hypothetical protein
MPINDPNACVLITPMSNGQVQVTIGDLNGGEFTPTHIVGCVPANAIPDPPITTLSQALRLLADHLDQTPPRSGLTNCACRDCGDVSISSDTRHPELCLLCKDAGCKPNNGECQRQDAPDTDN